MKYKGFKDFILYKKKKTIKECAKELKIPYILFLLKLWGILDFKVDEFQKIVSTYCLKEEEARMLFYLIK